MNYLSADDEIVESSIRQKLGKIPDVSAGVGSGSDFLIPPLHRRHKLPRDCDRLMNAVTLKKGMFSPQDLQGISPTNGR
jgi:hypothetical protein